MTSTLPPSWLIRGAVAAVWLYEGLWCKLLRREPRQLEIVAAVPRLGPRFGSAFLTLLGSFEVALGLWAASGRAALAAALVQTALLAALNTAGIVFARARIHDPAGMVLKNAAFLLLAWVAAGLAP